mgnify:CR=1 FL=1
MNDSSQPQMTFNQVVSLIVSMMVSLLPFYTQLSWWVPIIALLLSIWGLLLRRIRVCNPARAV